MTKFAQILWSTLLLLRSTHADDSFSDSPTNWSLHPLLYRHVPSQIVATSMADITVLRFVFYISLLLALAYPLTHKLLLKMSSRYRAIKDINKQIVVTHHALEALVLFLLFPFFSYFILRLNFQDTQNVDEIISNFQGAGKCGLVLMLMYLFELASRFDTPSPLIIFHHILAYLDAFLCMAFPTSIMMKTVGVLSYFICFEAPTFMGLFMYRIYPESKITPIVILFGMLCFGISRPLQVAWIGAAIFGSWNDENVVKWQGVMQVIVTLILTGIQVLALKIHYGVWKRCIAKGKSRMIVDGIECSGRTEHENVDDNNVEEKI